MSEKKTNGLGIASLILGILGLVFSCLTIGILPAIIGLLLGIIGLCLKDKKKGTAVAGVVCSAVGIGIALIVILIGSSVSESTKENKTIDVTANETTESEVTQEEITENVEEDNRSEYVEAGGSFETDSLRVTINEADVDFTDYEDEYGWHTPEEGMKYVMVSFTFENIGDSDQYVSLYDFDCYADNTTCEQVYGLDDNDFVNTNLSSGRNVSFKTYYSVPVDCESIELEYETNIWSNEKVIIKIQ